MLENVIKYCELLLKEKKNQQKNIDLQIKVLEEEIEFYKALNKKEAK